MFYFRIERFHFPKYVCSGILSQPKYHFIHTRTMQKCKADLPKKERLCGLLLCRKLAVMQSNIRGVATCVDQYKICSDVDRSILQVFLIICELIMALAFKLIQTLQKGHSTTSSQQVSELIWGWSCSLSTPPWEYQHILVEVLKVVPIW